MPPQPLTPQQRAAQLSFLDNLLSQDPGILRNLLLHPAARMATRTQQASQGQFMPRSDYASTTFDIANLMDAAGGTPTPVPAGALGAGMLARRHPAEAPQLRPSSKALDDPELAKHILGVASGRARDQSQVLQARQMAQSILDDINMTFGSADQQMGTVVMVGGIPLPMRTLFELAGRAPRGLSQEPSGEELPALMGNQS
jgi:hypothetical protein